MTSVATVQVPAKINIQLLVGPLRSDGFHDLATVFHALELWDTVSLRAASGPQTLTVSGSFTDGVPCDASNLAWRAVELVRAELPDAGHQAVDIHIEKHIPIAGGMAGGSADAAAALVAARQFWWDRGGAGLSDERLYELAAQLGSDVPFCLHGDSAIGTGRGEKLISLPSRHSFHWVIAAATFGLSTPAVFAQLDAMREGTQVPQPWIGQAVQDALAMGDVHTLAAVLINDLQPAALALAPQLQETLDTGMAAGALRTMVSGSGPTVLALAPDANSAAAIAEAWQRLDHVSLTATATGPVPGAMGDFTR